MSEKIDQIASAFEEFKKLNDSRIKAIETKGFAPADLVEKVEKANAEIDRLSTELKAAQTAMNRSGGKDDKASGNKAHRDAFMKFMRKGDDVELKALSVGTDADGGYLVNEEISKEIVTKVFESSPMRQLASAQTISSDRLEIITDLEEAAAAWVAETAARPATATPQFGQLLINVHEMYANPQATQKVLDDAYINLESWLAEKVASKFARTEATAFISGSGSGQPKGILSYTAGTNISAGEVEQINSGDAAALTANGLIELVYGLKGAYKMGASFLLKRSSLSEIRKLTDLQGMYIWQPGLQVGQPDSLLGYPVAEADDMPAVAANALAVAFGNFKAAYQIVDRFGVRVLRDPFTNKPYVGFYTTKRVGGAVKNFEAYKIQKIAV